MSNSFYFGLCIGLTVVIALLCYRYKKDHKCEFDERQEIARGKAYRAGFYSLLIYFAASEFASDILEHNWCDHWTNLGLGLGAGLGVFVVTCILNDAYVGMNQKMSKQILLVGILGIFNLLIGIDQMKDHYFKSSGEFSLPLNLTLGAILVIAAFTQLIKQKLSRIEVE